MAHALQAEDTFTAVTARVVPRRDVSLLILEIDNEDAGLLIPQIARLIEQTRDLRPVSRSRTMLLEASP